MRGSGLRGLVRHLREQLLPGGHQRVAARRPHGRGSEEGRAMRGPSQERAPVRPGCCTCLARRSVWPPARSPRWPRLTGSLPVARMRGAWRPFLITQVSQLGFGTVACSSALPHCLAGQGGSAFSTAPARPPAPHAALAAPALAPTSRALYQDGDGQACLRGWLFLLGEMALRVVFCRSLAAVPHWAPATSGIRRGIIRARARLDASTTSGPSPRHSQQPHVDTFPGTRFAH
jgi:hypothetical protein